MRMPSRTRTVGPMKPMTMRRRNRPPLIMSPPRKPAGAWAVANNRVLQRTPGLFLPEREGRRGSGHDDDRGGEDVDGKEIGADCEWTDGDHLRPPHCCSGGIEPPVA